MFSVAVLLTKTTSVRSGRHRLKTTGIEDIPLAVI